MIRYDLRCAAGHDFDSWFRDSGAYDALRAQGAVACAVCGSVEVEKALMTPRIGKAGSARPESSNPAPAEAPAPALSAPPEHPLAKALAALREHVEKTADYVGREFAQEARRIHLGESETRPIWGEATRAEAEGLREEGVPVAPLPLLPRRND